MIAIILAAGMGKRLYPLTKDVPKCLLIIGGKTIIERQIEVLKDCKINKIFVAVGYLGNQIREKVKNVRFVSNPFFRFTNSIASLWFVLNNLDETDDLVILNGDVFVERSIIDKVVHSKIKQITMLIDDGVAYEKADFKLYVQKGYVKKMGKTLERDEYSGEYAGVVRVPKSKYNAFKSAVQEMVHREEFDKWYELTIELFGFNTKVIKTEGRYWIEIDSEKDLRSPKIDKI
jgi:choline kinase